MSRFRTIIALVVILLVFLNVVASPVWAEQSNASTAISSAKNRILDCYNAVKDAEAAGANITTLAATLDEAGALLSQAELAYAAKDFSTSFNLATQSLNRLNNFVDEANTSMEVAIQQQNIDFLINVVGSIIGTLAVIIAGFAVWRFLKKKYEKTEVYANESPRV
ncbi:hypothetical protein E2P61_02620 [Candidatus Bathyarchaeota archaeon]|nr:hypothetical protein E2P61_02620 [Candidatus Bathyarchaeota archaeon]